MELTFGRIVILVNDYDEAYEFYERILNCKKFFDLENNGQRFLHISLNSNDKSGIWLLKAETDEQKKLVGNQTGGMPAFVVYSDSLDEFYVHLLNENVKITREPSEFGGNRFFHFLDLYGNEIVMVEMKVNIEQTH